MALKTEKWDCVKGCGACCKLDPYKRIDAIKVLTVEEQNIYMKMVGEDGWCVYYDKLNRKCNIYKKRPSFCRVSNISKTFKIKSIESNNFAIKCCKQNIKEIYGGRSKVMKNFNKNIK